MIIIDHEPALTTCPDWCRYPAADHGWSDEMPDGRFARGHVIEFGTVPASGDNNLPAAGDSNPRRADAFVALEQLEATDGTAYELFTPTINLAADNWPHFTADEARRVAAMLTAAADRLDEIQHRCNPNGSEGVEGGASE